MEAELLGYDLEHVHTEPNVSRIASQRTELICFHQKRLLLQSQKSHIVSTYISQEGGRGRENLRDINGEGQRERTRGEGQRERMRGEAQRERTRGEAQRERTRGEGEKEGQRGEGGERGEGIEREVEENTDQHGGNC